MTETTPVRRTRPLAVLALVLAGAWILTGALFKLLQGSPALLPSFMRDLPVSLEVIYPSVIGIELAVVAVAWLRPRPGWVLLALQYLVFFGVLGMQIAGGEESCGCMGSQVELTPWQMLAIDGTLLALLLAARPWSGIVFSGLPLPLVAFVAAALVAVPWFGGRGRAVRPEQLRPAPAAPVRTDEALEAAAPPALRTPEPGEQPSDTVDVALAPADGPRAGDDGRGAAERPAPAPAPAPTGGASQGWTVLDPAEWVGQDVFSLDVAEWLGEELVSTLPFDGLWVFYRQQCDHCRDHLLELANSEQGQRQVALIRVPEPSDTTDNSVIVVKPQGPHVIEVALPGGIDYVLSTPADATVEGGVVVGARENIQAGH